AFEETDKGCRRTFDPFGNIFGVDELSFVDPSGHLGLCLTETLEIIKHHKPLHPQAMRDEARHIADADKLVVRAVIFADLTGNDDAAMLLHVEDRRIKHLAADIVEIDIDAFRAMLADRRAQISAAIGEAIIEAEAFDIVTLCRRTGDTDDTAAFLLCDLPGCGPHRSRRRGDQDGLARTGCAEFQKAEIGGEARNAEHANRGGRAELAVKHLRRKYLHAAPVRNGMCHPAKAACHAVAWLELLVLRGFDNANHRTVDGLAKGKGGRVAIPRKAAAHPRIDRVIFRADQDFMLANIRQRYFFQPEVLKPRLSFRP